MILEDVWLLLESALALDCQFGRHDCGVEQSLRMARNLLLFRVGSAGVGQSCVDLLEFGLTVLALWALGPAFRKCRTEEGTAGLF